jgi:hypothetical protein
VQIIHFFQQGAFAVIQLAIILVFHIMQPQEYLPLAEPRIIQQVSAMDPLHQDGVIVSQKIFQQLAAAAGTNDIGQLVRESFMSFPAGIIFHLRAISVQLRPRAPSIFEAMQLDLHTCPMQAAYLVERVDYPPVICRVGNVHAYNM